MGRGFDQKYKVTMHDGTVHEVETAFQDQLRWEAQHNGEAWLSGGVPSFTKLVETAFYALRRTGVVEVKIFEKFARQVADFEVVDDDEDDEDEIEGEDVEESTFP